MDEVARLAAVARTAQVEQLAANEAAAEARARRDEAVRSLKALGVGVSEIARRVGMTPPAVQYVIGQIPRTTRRYRWERKDSEESTGQGE